jgi:hypothetical protein
MNTVVRLVEMILRGKTDQFKTVMKEELEHRTSILMEKLYKNESEALLESGEESAVSEPQIQKNIDPIIKENTTPKFIPENAYYLKDGNIGILNESEKQLVSKLYEKLNSINKERLLKLLSESKQSFNRVLNLAKNENKGKE